MPTEDYIFLNTMTFPAFYNIQNLPKNIKQQIDDKLMSSPHNPKFRQIVDFMWLDKDVRDAIEQSWNVYRSLH